MTDDPTEPGDEKLRDLVAGRLPEAEAERLRARAAAAPALAAEIALLGGVRAALAAETAQGAPGELGWARLNRAIDAEAATRPPRRSVALWQAAAAAAAAVVLWQAVAVPLVPGLRPGGPGYAPVTETPAAGFVLRVAFVPEAPEAAVRALLRETGAVVTGTPSALGLWTLGFADAASRDAALARFRAAAGVVESAQAE
jgi:hypothetical protein